VRYKLYTGVMCVTGIGAVSGMAMAKIYLIDEDTPVVMKRYVNNPEKE
jgi:hypothetical protein